MARNVVKILLFSHKLLLPIIRLSNYIVRDNKVFWGGLGQTWSELRVRYEEGKEGEEWEEGEEREEGERRQSDNDWFQDVRSRNVSDLNKTLVA